MSLDAIQQNSLSMGELDKRYNRLLKEMDALEKKKKESKLSRGESGRLSELKKEIGIIKEYFLRLITNIQKSIEEEKQFV